MSTEIDDVVTGLTAEDESVRLAAAESLMQLGAEAQPAAVALAQAAGDPVDAVREAAVGALEELGPPLVEDVPRLIELLSDASPDVAYWAATLLGRLEAEGAAAVEPLAALATSKADVNPRDAQIWALGQIGEAAQPAIPSLEKLAADANPRLAKLAKQSLEKIGSQ